MCREAQPRHLSPVFPASSSAVRFEVSQGEFRTDINRIFQPYGLARELTETGHIERLAAPVLREVIASPLSPSGDTELDRMLETARREFLDPDKATRREALEALGDAWEGAMEDVGQRTGQEVTGHVGLTPASRCSATVPVPAGRTASGSERTWWRKRSARTTQPGPGPPHQTYRPRRSGHPRVPDRRSPLRDRHGAPSPGTNTSSPGCSHAVTGRPLSCSPARRGPRSAADRRRYRFRAAEAAGRVRPAAASGPGRAAGSR